ncbi:MAG: dephospho-CoA kinase, partial [Halobacteria archaeon]|nr:dephospho-CoA kinase [Halobacteria archaeon]
GIQAPRQNRLALADDVINNDGTLDELGAQVHTQHEKYLEFTAHGAT